MIKVGLYIATMFLLIFGSSYFGSVWVTFAAIFVPLSLAVWLLDLHKIEMKWYQLVFVIAGIVALMLLASYYTINFTSYKYGLLTLVAAGLGISVVGLINK